MMVYGKSVKGAVSLDLIEQPGHASINSTAPVWTNGSITAAKLFFGELTSGATSTAVNHEVGLGIKSCCSQSCS